MQLNIITSSFFSWKPLILNHTMSSFKCIHALLLYAWSVPGICSRHILVIYLNKYNLYKQISIILGSPDNLKFYFSNNILNLSSSVLISIRQIKNRFPTHQDPRITLHGSNIIPAEFSIYWRNSREMVFETKSALRSRNKVNR